jgi:NAD-dependent dihydropyrimidine dehydrogenase PreA subunit
MALDASASCKFDAGIVGPVIDPLRCEAKGPCVPICPYGVLAVHVVPPDQKAAMSLIARLKLFVHGGKQAFVLNKDACHGCGLCVEVCPEKAITLRRNAAAGPRQVAG